MTTETIEWPTSIRGINNLQRKVKESIYYTLIPESIPRRFGIAYDDPERIKVVCPEDTRSVEIRVYPDESYPRPRDPIFYIHMADTMNNQIAMLLLIVNDPDSPRFFTDVTEHGHPTRFATIKRNIDEEIRAMQAGLSPGQVRRGLRLSHEVLPTLERFLKRAGHDMIILEPLTYNNAIHYERYGFAYLYGRKRMEWINDVLRPGGDYFHLFDDSSPFRATDAWKSIRGRSWAIHDGILDEPFGDLRMYKRLGTSADVNTFPDGVW